jgi:hydroxyacylglutathione hydrolase
MERISMEEFSKRILSKQSPTGIQTPAEGELLLDVRSRQEFMAGHIPGSTNIPHDEVGFQAAKLATYPKIYVYCQMGGRSQMAAEWLVSLGLKNLVCIDDGGMGYWMDLRLPTVRS